MSKNYLVKVNDISEFSISEDKVISADIISSDDFKFHVIHENISYKAAIIDSSFNQKSYKVKVNNNIYNINIFNELDSLIKDMGFEVGLTKVINNIKAPMPGLILEVNVKNGQEVKEDDALLILEAMKMENVLTAPRDGIIKSISASKGDAVEKNQLLITLQ